MIDCQEPWAVAGAEYYVQDSGRTIFRNFFSKATESGETEPSSYISRLIESGNLPSWAFWTKFANWAKSCRGWEMIASLSMCPQVFSKIKQP